MCQVNRVPSRAEFEEHHTAQLRPKRASAAISLAGMIESHSSLTTLNRSHNALRLHAAEVTCNERWLPVAAALVRQLPRDSMRVIGIVWQLAGFIC